MTGQHLRVLEHLSDCILAVSRDGRVLSCNRAARNFFRVQNDAAVGRPLHEVLRAEEKVIDWDSLAEEVAEAGIVRHRVPCTLQARSATPIELELVPLGLEDDPVAGFLVTARRGLSDATYYRGSAPSAPLFAAILDSIREVVFIRDAERRLVYCNPSLERVTGYTAEEVMEAEDLVNIIHQEDLPGFFETVERWEAGERDLDFVGRYTHKDGTQRWFRNRVAPAQIDGQMRFIVTLDDLTKEKEAEAALRTARNELEARVAERTLELEEALTQLEADIARRERAEAERDQYEAELRRKNTLEAMGRLAGGVAHDFNNLLGSILGCLYVASLNTSNSPAVAEELDRAQELCKTGGELTRRLLAVARRHPGHKRPIDLHALLEEVRLLLGRTLAQEIQLVIPPALPGLPRVRADRSLLTAALLNLAFNARDAMPAGGILTIGAKREVSSNGEEFAVIEVQDTGEGIPEDLQEKVFEPFFTTKPPDRGSGLGLSMVHATVQECGGEMSVESAEGQGSRFVLRLPADSATGSRLQGISEVRQRGHPFTSGRVLVVEDGEDMARFMVEVLQRHGYQTLRARTGVDALDMLREHLGTVSLVTLDLMLPELPGDRVHNFLKSMVPDIPVLFTTGREDLAREVDPTVPVLPKPFTDQCLLNGVSAALVGAGPEAEPG